MNNDTAKRPLACIEHDYQLKPDYEHWSRMSLWTVEQANALLLDLDPDYITAEFVDNQPHSSPHLQTAHKRYKRLQQLLLSACAAEDFGKWLAPYPDTSKVSPSTLINWAESKGVEVPSALHGVVQAKADQPSYIELAEENKRLAAEIERLKPQQGSLVEPKNKKTLLRIIGLLTKALTERAGFNNDIQAIAAHLTTYINNSKRGLGQDNLRKLLAEGQSELEHISR